MPPALDLKFGDKRGRLTILERAGNNKWGEVRWKCECQCGKIVIRESSTLKIDNKQSCGCLRDERIGSLNYKHGGRKNFRKEYDTWKHFCQRCSNPNSPDYKNYGARGIKVCDRWQGEHGFENFLDDMGPCPGPEYTMERLDNDKNYCMENCVWATRLTQNNNTRRNVFVTYKGRRQTLSQWTRELGCKLGVLRRRKELGWDDEDIIGKPIRKMKCRS